jgi:hypothetical protein
MARDFKTYTFAAVRGANGTLVVFICDHCPYARRDFFEADTGHGPEDQTPSAGCSIKWKD